jgi:hypothetical protein
MSCAGARDVYRKACGSKVQRCHPALETVPARGERTVGPARQSLIARWHLVTVGTWLLWKSVLQWKSVSGWRVLLAMDSRHNIQSSKRFLKREIGDVGSIAHASSQIRRHVAAKMACQSHARSLARPQNFSLAHPPLGQFPGHFSRPPMAGSSSLSIVSSGIFGSIGTLRKNITIERSGVSRGLTRGGAAWYRGTRWPRRRGRMSFGENELRCGLSQRVAPGDAANG